jgi:ABC-type multidrug transport system permease subunit
MNALRAITATILKEWKTAEENFQSLLRLFADIMRSAAMAWIVSQGNNTSILAYISVGIPMIAIWRGVLATGGWSLEKELQGKTLDFTLISRTPMGIILLSQAIGQTFREIPSGITALGAVLLVSRMIPEVANITLLPFSVFLALVGLAITGYFFAALVVLAKGRAGFFMGMVPFGAVLSGLILPVDHLPPGLAVVAQCFPASWAMKSVWLCIIGTESWWPVVYGWGMFLLVGIIWFVGTYFLCMVVEKRIRISGTLGAF